jgi:hypothetical protein
MPNGPACVRAARAAAHIDSRNRLLHSFPPIGRIRPEQYNGPAGCLAAGAVANEVGTMALGGASQLVLVAHFMNRS